MDLFSSPPPLAPPTSEEDRLSRLRLLRSRRVGSSTFYRLMADHGGNAQAALAALPEIAQAAGVKEYTACPPEFAEREMEAGSAAGATLLFFDDPAYPAMLAELDEAPPLLWARGRGDLVHHPAIAMVGARNASSLGRRMARSLADGLGEAGQMIVSGLARGIDAEAHRAALPHGTIAVVAGGVDVVYPRENQKLTDDIAQSGLILSEMPPGCQPQARHFPRRNRIISGLAQAVVVVEAAAKSGSLITARDALDQGRDVLAVPGHPFDARAAGCNMLIRDGARLVRGAEDVLEALAIPRPSADSPAHPTPTPTPEPETGQTDREPSATDLPARILALLGPAPVAEDQLLRDLGLSPRELADHLLALELEGRVIRQPGGLLALAV